MELKPASQPAPYYQSKWCITVEVMTRLAVQVLDDKLGNVCMTTSFGASHSEHGIDLFSIKVLLFLVSSWRHTSSRESRFTDSKSLSKLVDFIAFGPRNMSRPDVHDIMDIPEIYDTTGVNDITKVWDTIQVGNSPKADVTPEADGTPEGEPKVESHYIYYLAIIEDCTSKTIPPRPPKLVRKFSGPFKDYADVVKARDIEALKRTSAGVKYSIMAAGPDAEIEFIDEQDFQDKNILDINLYDNVDKLGEPKTVLRIFREDNKEVFDCEPTKVVYPMVSNGPVSWNEDVIGAIHVVPTAPWAAPGWAMKLRLWGTFIDKRTAYRQGRDCMQQLAGTTGPIGMNFNDDLQENGELVSVYVNVVTMTTMSVTRHCRVGGASAEPEGSDRGRSLHQWLPEQPQGRDTRV